MSCEKSRDPVQGGAVFLPLPLRRGGRILVEVVSEGPHCVPCEYAIAAVEYVAEDYEDRIDVRIVETKRAEDAQRYFELCRIYGGLVPVPSILFSGVVAFEGIPGPDELREALQKELGK